MPHNKLRAFILSCLTTFTLSACSLHTIKSDQTQSNPDSQESIYNLLDPDVTTEEQAFAKGEALYNEGKLENALFYYIKTLQINNNNIKALERIATIHSRTKHPELAVKIYKEILAIDKNNLLANENLGLYSLENGQTGKAKQYLSTVVKINNNNWKAHNGLGVIADLEHNTDEAIAQYEDALELEPNNPMILNNLGYSHYLAGNPIKAKYLFTQALNYDNKYKRAIHNLALIEIKNGNFTTATALFNRIMPVHESYNNVGYICMLNGQYAAAEEYLRRAIDESPVYFPKAQANLKSLMSLKRRTNLYDETPIAPAPPTEPAIGASDSESTAPPPPQDKQPQADQIKPVSKTANRPTVSSNKSVNKPISSPPAVANSATEKKNTPPSRPVAKKESQNQILTTHSSGGSVTKAVESRAQSKPDVPVSRQAEKLKNQPVSAQSKVIDPPAHTKDAPDKNTAAPSQVIAQPEQRQQQSMKKEIGDTEAKTVEVKIPTAAPAPVQAENAGNPETQSASQSSAVSQESLKVDSAVVQPAVVQPTVKTDAKASQPEPQAAPQSQIKAQQNIKNETETTESAVTEPQTENSATVPSLVGNLQSRSLPVQTDTLTLEPPQKITFPVHQTTFKMGADSSPQPDVKPAAQSPDTADKGINQETGDARAEAVESKNGNTTSVSSDAKNQDIKPEPVQPAPAIQKPQ